MGIKSKLRDPKEFVLSGFYKNPSILATRIESDINAIVYKADPLTPNKERIYEMAFFNKADAGFYHHTQTYNLIALYKKYCSQNQIDRAQEKIRQLGDPILHQEAETVIDFSTIRLRNQLQVLKETLTNTGGVGIAANQCSEITDPLKLILVGVDYNNPEHVIKSIARYPDTLFPQMKVYINPEIVNLSNQTDFFAEGCLSVRGQLRGLTKRPKSVTVRYQDLNGSEHEDCFNGSDARVMLHELDHILNGKVYIQRIVDELNKSQCQTLIDIIESVIPNSLISNPSLSPALVFERKQNGEVVFDKEKAKECLKGMNRNTLRELCDVLYQKVKLGKITKL